MKAIIAVLLVWSGYMLGLWLLSWMELRKERGTEYTPYVQRVLGRRTVTERVYDCDVLIPAKNEEKVISATVAAWKRCVGVRAVIVLDDDSVDRTAVVAREAGAMVLDSRILPIHRHGKPGILDCYLRFRGADDDGARVPVLIADADNVPADVDTASRLAAWYHYHGQVPVQGRVVSRGGNWLQDGIACERSTAWALMEGSRAGMLGCTAIAGATGMMVGGERLMLGWPQYTCDDLAATIMAASFGNKIEYAPSVPVLEQVPAGVRELLRQRVRWVRGTWQCLPLWVRRYACQKKLVGVEFGILFAAQAVVSVAVLFLIPVGFLRSSSVGLALGLIGDILWLLPGAVRTHRWRGMLVAPFIALVNFFALVWGSLTWFEGSPSWRPTVKGAK